MRKLSCLTVVFLVSLFHLGIAANSNHSDMMEDMANSMEDSEQIDIAILVYDDVVLQDFAGPLEVFSKAKNLTKKYNIFTVALSDSVISTENGLVKITPDYSYSNMPEADYLVIPGAGMPVINTMMGQDSLTDFINHWNNKKDTKIVSICTGAYLLANTGALKNRKATTHYFVADDFSREFEEIQVIKDVRFVDEGKYITSSGITSGIDVALYVVGQNSGVDLRDMISRALQYTFHEKEDWPVAPNGMKYERH